MRRRSGAVLGAGCLRPVTVQFVMTQYTSQVVVVLLSSSSLVLHYTSYPFHACVLVKLVM
jgi:hypothetical protein